MKTKFLLAMGLPLALLAGCNQNNTSQPSAQSDAPAGSTAKVSEEKTGVVKANPMDAEAYTTKLDFKSDKVLRAARKSACACT